MDVTATAIPDVKILTPKKFGDHRGFFCEVYSAPALSKLGIEHVFLQDNQSLSSQKGVVRGLHYQIGATAQAKLVRVLRGAILDVAVDIRRASPTFGKHVAEVISEANWRQILIPKGFAHGFVTLEPDTMVLYKVTAPYSPKDERGIAWDDPALGIGWGVSGSDAILSDKDRKYPRLTDAVDLF